jgi:hypothetical protein
MEVGCDTRFDKQVPVIHPLKLYYKNFERISHFSYMLHVSTSFFSYTIIGYKQADFLGLPSYLSHDFLHSFVIPRFVVQVLQSALCPLTFYILPQ